MKPAEAVKIPSGLVIVVTKADIKKSRDDRTCGCPVEIALSRVLGKPCVVGYETSWLPDGARRLQAVANVPGHNPIVMGEDVLDFMRSFDQGMNVAPTAFELVKGP